MIDEGWETFILNRENIKDDNLGRVIKFSTLFIFKGIVEKINNFCVIRVKL